MHFWNIFGDCVHFSLCFLQFQTFLPVLTEKKRLVAFHHLSFSIFPNTSLALDIWITHIQSDSLVQNSSKHWGQYHVLLATPQHYTMYELTEHWNKLTFLGQTEDTVCRLNLFNVEDVRPLLSQVVKFDNRFHPQWRRKYRQLCREGGLLSTFSALAGLTFKAYSSFFTFVTSWRTWQEEIAKWEIAFSALWSLQCDFDLLHQKEHIAQFLPSRHSCIMSVKNNFEPVQWGRTNREWYSIDKVTRDGTFLWVHWVSVTHSSVQADPWVIQPIRPKPIFHMQRN